MPLSKIDSDSLNSGAVTSTALASGVPTRAQLPAGTVLQVVSANSLSTTGTSSTTFVATNLSATITPTSSTSKVLILCSYSVWGTASAEYCIGTVFRNAGNLGAGASSALSTTGGYAWGGSAGYDVYSNIMYLDSPATTSATVYKLYVKSSGGNAVYAVDSAWNNSITLLEIAA